MRALNLSFLELKRRKILFNPQLDRNGNFQVQTF